MSSKIKQRAQRRGEKLTKNEVENRTLQSRVDKALAKRGNTRVLQPIYGHGNYWDKFKSIFNKGDFKKAGGWLGDAISKVVGFGDYDIKKNSIIEMQVDGHTAKNFSFSNFGTSTIRVQKREYIGDVRSPSTDFDLFTQTSYRLQPTDATTFPWVSQIAGLYTEYQILGAIFTFETTSSNYAANMGLGTVALATQYNSNSLPFSSMSAVLQSAYHTRGNPSETLIHGIECDPELQASERLYTRRPGNQGPANLYDHGVVTIATEGLPAGDVGLGRLYVTYDIEFSLPELPIIPPWHNDVGLATNSFVAANEPPLGRATSLSAVGASQMTVGTTAGSNILCFTAANGPVATPVLTASEQNNLVVWVNDSSVTSTLQYMSFARKGRYNLTINFCRTGGADPGDAALTVAALRDTVVDQLSSYVVVSSTDHSREWIVEVTVNVAGGSVTLSNADAAAHTAFCQVSYCG